MVIAGGVVSRTVIDEEQELVFPDWSVAVYVTVVVPSGSAAVPDGPATVTGPAMSNAAAEPGVTNADSLPVASAVIGPGHVIDGGVVSTTVIVVWQLTLLALLS